MMKTILFALAAFVACAVAQNAACTLVIPKNTFTAQGLATPYLLKATDPAMGPCDQVNNAQSAFVQAGVVDLDTGALYVYNPLVITQGTTPAANPVVPQLPVNYIAAVWFGYNGNSLTLEGADHLTLDLANCVNGIPGSIFGQFAHCNGNQFFAVLNQLYNDGMIAVPQLGTALDGLPCPTVRDFSVVDMDQSDNVVTQYLIVGGTQLAQKTTRNMQDFPDAVTLSNGSDNGLLVRFINPALNCTDWAVTDLADPATMKSALFLDEFMASVRQPPPVAVIPAKDPMVLDNNGNTNTIKLNAYRSGVGQPLVNEDCEASTRRYCKKMWRATARIVTDRTWTINAPSPQDGATNLYAFLAQRFMGAFGTDGLNCTILLNVANPVTLIMDNAGNAIDATFVVPTVNHRVVLNDDNDPTLNDCADGSVVSVMTFLVFLLAIFAF